MRYNYACCQLPKIFNRRFYLSGIAFFCMDFQLSRRFGEHIEADRTAGLVLEGVAAVLSERPSALRLRLWVTPEDSGQARAGLLETASRLSGSDLAIRLDRSTDALPRRRSTVPSKPESPAGKAVPRGRFPS